MSDTTSTEAVNDGPLSMSEAITALQEPETAEDSQEQTETEDGDEGETPDDAQTDDEGEDEDTGTEEPDAEDEEDESDEYAGGRFAADTARVTMPDGSTITVAELKRGNLRDRDYTQGKQAIAEERKALEANRTQVQQLERQIAEQRQLVATFAQKLMPQPPSREMMDTDPLGYMQAKADYDDHVARINHLGSIQQQEEARRQAETAEQAQARRATEAQRLLEAMPELKDPQRYGDFFSNSVKTMERYGYAPEEVAGADDHRMYLVFKDLQRLAKMEAARPAVQKRVEGSPPVLRAGKRTSPEQQGAQARQAALDRLTKTGSLDDAVALLKMR